MPTIRVVTEIAAPIERCFDLARCIAFHEHSMRSTGERAVGGVTSGLIQGGQEVTWRARHFGVSQTLKSRIVEFERPRCFVDEQVRGAFAMLRHTHRFEAREHVTLMTDEMEFRAPLGLLGRAAESMFLGAYMRRFLVGHTSRLKAALESQEWRAFLQSGL
jgi:ligand-binding SRPBCC domain-containing protein